MISFGKSKQVYFANDNEYYFVLGFLTHPGAIEIRVEHNEDQGAWGIEGRIYCYWPIDRYPPNFKLTKGRGNVTARINCNDYVEQLIRRHHFSENTRHQNVSIIMSTVPEKYLSDFKRGMNS